MSSITRRTSLRSLAAGGTMAALLAVAGCSTDGDGATDSQSTGSAPGFPVSLDHAFGTTEIPDKPKRIVTIGWMAHDVVAALGIAPVGVPEAWGGDADGYNPWFRTQIEDELHAELPTVLPDEEEPDYEGILALEPDLILAPHSGLTDDQYAQLTEIAPTLAYQGKPWVSEGWRDMTATVGKALGESDKADRLVTHTEKTMKNAIDAHPALEGTEFLYGQTFPEGQNNLYIYTSDDPRVSFLREFGLVDSPSLERAVSNAEKDSYYGTLSLEDLDPLDADVFVAWSDAPEQTKHSLYHPTFSRWTPIAGGNYLVLEDAAMGMATNGPTVLSIPWAIDEGFLDDLTSAKDGDAVVRTAGR